MRKPEEGRMRRRDVLMLLPEVILVELAGSRRVLLHSNAAQRICSILRAAGHSFWRMETSPFCQVSLKVLWDCRLPLWRADHCGK